MYSSVPLEYVSYNNLRLPQRESHLPRRLDIPVN